MCATGPEFSAREDRLWLNDYFHRGATDVFRTFHPMRSIPLQETPPLSSGKHLPIHNPYSAHHHRREMLMQHQIRILYLLPSTRSQNYSSQTSTPRSRFILVWHCYCLLVHCSASSVCSDTFHALASLIEERALGLAGAVSLHFTPLGSKPECCTLLS